MKNTKRITALLMTVVMLVCLTACSGTTDYMDFLKNGWDGGAEPTEAAPENTDTEDETLPEEEPSEVEPSETAAQNTGKPSKGNASANTGTAGNNTAGNSSQSKPQQNNGGASSQVNKPAQGATNAPQKNTYTAAEALELYKTAANAVKSNNNATCTRNKEIITTISGSIPSMYQTFGFKPGTNTEKKVCAGTSEIKKGFCVEGQAFVCDLSVSDIKSATVSNSGSNKIVTINVKDDTAGTYDRSKKCVSTINIPIGTWTCKGVVVKGTINSKGQLVELYYNMPTHVTSGSNAFAFSLEQYWTITY